jgi:hypothetical protein
LISENTAKELNIVRNVWNVFAHATANLNFEAPIIHEAIKRSRIVKIATEKLGEQLAKESLRAPKAKTSSDFVMLVRILFVLLDFRQRDVGGDALSD